MNPTYEEIEAKIALLEVQLKLSEAAERAWESSMKRACGEDGPKSVADKFAELESKLETALRECRSAGITIDNIEAKCAALAAENERLKSAHPQPFGHEMMKALDAYEKHQDEVPENGMLDAFFILRDSIRVTTSVTDAWVNEQHAIGVDMVVKYHMERADALKEVNRKGYFYHSSAALDALDVAAQLRQDAKTAELVAAGIGIKGECE